MIATSLEALLLRGEDAARYLGVSRTALFELQASGALVGVKVGGRRFWRQTDLDAFAAALTPQPPTIVVEADET